MFEHTRHRTRSCDRQNERPGFLRRNPGLEWFELGRRYALPSPGSCSFMLPMRPFIREPTNVHDARGRATPPWKGSGWSRKWSMSFTVRSSDGGGSARTRADVVSAAIGYPGPNSKDSSHLRQDGCDNLLHRVPREQRVVPPLTVVRRNNVVTLFQQFAEAQMRAGVAPKGLEQAFAQTLQVSPSMWSQIKSSRPIGDKLARQIEAACKLEHGWLDVERPSEARNDVRGSQTVEGAAARPRLNASSTKQPGSPLRRVSAPARACRSQTATACRPTPGSPCGTPIGLLRRLDETC